MKHARRISEYFHTGIRPNRLGALSLALVLCLAGMATHAEASDKKASREREALRRVQQQLSQAQAQLATLEQEKGKLAEDLDKVQGASKAAEGRAARLQRELKSGKQQQASLAQELELAKESLATTSQNLDETRKSLAETTQALQQTEADKRNLEAIKVRNERDMAACERNNLALYGIGRSLMERFENKTCGETLAQKEPFTGLRKVETENLLEEYRDKLDEQKLVKPPGG
jgi:predicted  nucleic acid-binding Zn-ribbon protein